MLTRSCSGAAACLSSSASACLLSAAVLSPADAALSVVAAVLCTDFVSLAAQAVAPSASKVTPRANAFFDFFISDRPLLYLVLYLVPYYDVQ